MLYHRVIDLYHYGFVYFQVFLMKAERLTLQTRQNERLTDCAEWLLDPNGFLTYLVI